MQLQCRDVTSGCQQNKTDKPDTEPAISFITIIIARQPISNYNMQKTTSEPTRGNEEGFKNKTGTEKRKRKGSRFPIVSRSEAEGPSMLIGVLISVLILQLCTTEESSRLSTSFSF